MVATSTPRHAVEEIDDAGFEEVLGADDGETFLANELLDDLRLAAGLSGDTSLVAFFQALESFTGGNHEARRVQVPGGPFFVNGAGGIVTTATDMAQWVATQANGGVGPNGARILSAGALTQTHTASTASNGYGFGWNANADGRISHSGGLPSHSAYVTFFEGGDGVVVFAPTGDSNVPRSIALAVLAHLEGKPVPQPSPGSAAPLDFVAAALIVINMIFTAWTIRRTGMWVQRQRPVWRTAMSLVLYAAAAAGVLVAFPILVGQLIPWSWIWLGYTAPVWTVFFLSVAATSLLILGVRGVALSRHSRTTIAHA